MSAFRKPLLAGAACAVLAALAACGSSSSSSTPAATPAASSAPASTPASSSPAASTSASSSPAAAISTPTQQTIAANWTAFFDPKEPASKRLALLQDGQQFAPALSGQATSATASQTSAKVIAVTVLSPAQAKVTYDLLLSGSPVLTNQSGTAVLENGTWKVSAASFCGLLALQSGGSTKSLPAVCKSAG